MSFKSEDLEGFSLIELGSLLQELREGLNNKNSIIIEHEINKRIKELKKESYLNSRGSIDYLRN